MAEPKRILIVRPSALGDVCRTVPVLVTLRRAYPDAAIDWVVQTEFAAAIESHPALTEAICFPRRDFARPWRNPPVGAAMWRWFRRLRRGSYDLAIDCQGLGRSGLITWATRARRRVGHRAARELAWLGYNVRHPASSAVHTVDRMMSLLVAEGLEPVYDMRLYLSDADRDWWRDHNPGEPFVVLAPTSRWPSKRWPQASWSALLDPLRERGLERAILVGGPSERGQVASMLESDAGDRLVDLVGRTSVGQSMAVIAGAALVVANDSAPLHMAVGFARPCVGLYGPTDPAQVGPHGAEDAVVRAEGGPANYREPTLGDELMRRISVQDVLDRVDHVLAARGRAAEMAERTAP